MAISGSRIAHCGTSTTTPRPARIPAVVHTSVSRCLASASIVMLSCWCATFSMTRAVMKFARRREQRDQHAEAELLQRLRREQPLRSRTR